MPASDFTWPQIPETRVQPDPQEDVTNLPGSTGQERGQKLDQYSFQPACSQSAKRGGAVIPPPTHESMNDG